jgi:hypothetical protein
MPPSCPIAPTGKYAGSGYSASSTTMERKEPKAGSRPGSSWGKPADSGATKSPRSNASLTELFAPQIHKDRLATWPQHYTWIDPEGLQYFRGRVSQARRDVEQGLAVTLDYFRSREQQERALDILQFKLDILWTMLDAMQIAYRKNP